MGFEPSHSWCFVGIKERQVSLDVFQIKFQGDFKKKHSSGRDPIEFCWPQIIMGWKKKSPFQWVHTYMVGWLVGDALVMTYPKFLNEWERIEIQGHNLEQGLQIQPLKSPKACGQHTTTPQGMWQSSGTCRSDNRYCSRSSYSNIML